MNYIKEINAFYDKLETNPLSTSSIALWHALLHINNKAGWIDEFAVSSSVLCVKSGLAERTISKARNELKQKGYIEFRSRGGNRSALYNMVSLSAIYADKYADNSSDKCADSSSDNHAVLFKLNKKDDDEKNYINPDMDFFVDHFLDMANSEGLPKQEVQRIVNEIGKGAPFTMSEITTAMMQTIKLWDSEPVNDMGKLFAANLEKEKRRSEWKQKRVSKLQQESKQQDSLVAEFKPYNWLEGAD